MTHLRPQHSIVAYSFGSYYTSHMCGSLAVVVVVEDFHSTEADSRVEDILAADSPVVGETWTLAVMDSLAAAVVEILTATVVDILRWDLPTVVRTPAAVVRS